MKIKATRCHQKKTYFADSKNVEAIFFPYKLLRTSKREKKLTAKINLNSKFSVTFTKSVFVHIF